jgi:large subunit ribosomal protein L24
VYVSNVNLVKRAHQAEPAGRPAGGIIEREASIHISNVMLFNPATGKGERTGFKVLEMDAHPRVPLQRRGRHLK